MTQKQDHENEAKRLYGIFHNLKDYEACDQFSNETQETKLAFLGLAKNFLDRQPFDIDTLYHILTVAKLAEIVPKLTSRELSIIDHVVTEVRRVLCIEEDKFECSEASG